MEKSLLIALAGCLMLAGCATPAPSSEATLPALTTTPSQQTPQSVFELPKAQWRDIPFVPEGGLNQRLDVYLPETGEGPFPTILAVHGGGFYSGSKAGYQRLAGAFTGMGYALVSANYRLAPKYSYPAQVEDVFCALAWIHANHGAHNLDSGRIVVMGESAGANLAAMLATVDDPGEYLRDCPHDLPESDWLQAAVLFYGSYDFTDAGNYPSRDVEEVLQPYWGAELGDISAEKLAEMSPQSWVDGSEAPFLIIHGTQDASIPSEMAEEFATVLEDAGVEVELLLLEANHAFLLLPLSASENVQSLQAMEAFLSKLPAQ
jgi:acetyl esterase/lipase